MPYALTDDGVRLYYEEAGTGEPIVFVHEFAGSYWSWEPQIRYFSRRHRCLVYAARGYPPSDVPEEVERYGQARAAADIGAVLDAAGIERAHVVGLSMGAFATLHFGLDQPSRALSLVCAGIGYGAHKDHEATFRRQAEEVARAFETQGSERFAPVYGSAAARVQYEAKDPRGYAELIQRLTKHSPRGAANTQRGVQARRPSLYDLEDRLAQLMAPTLVIAGDEDDQTLLPGIYLKRTIPACGLLVLPKTGHAINLEEPEAFNRAVAEFLAQVAAGRWGPRDPRARPDALLRTS
ncbi:MAG TPA: alpha/beta hydrolase [Geminicoccaceae bacterium]|nr:alpha/beta hydrolase [Geminicoccaceae bacterium]